MDESGTLSWLDQRMPVFTVLCDGAERAVEIHLERLSVTPADFETVTGWRLEERGLCRGDACIPARVDDVLVDGRVDLAGAAAVMARPWAVEPVAHVAVIGEAASARSAALASLQAPEFELPDLAGKLHRLSQFRGRKVLLAAYASW